MAYQQGQFMSTVMTRINELRTTVRGRVDQVRARVTGAGGIGGGMFKGLMNRQAPIKTFSKGFAGPRMLDRFRTRSTSTPTHNSMVPPPRTPPGAPIMSFNQPGSPIKTFAKENLRAIKTF